MSVASLLRAAVQTFGWGLGDQALSSLTNFVLSFLVARSVSPAHFGAFSLAFTVYLTAMGVSRTQTTDPFLVRFSGVSETSWRRGARAATGFAASLGALAGVGCLLAGWALGPPEDGPFVALGLVLPGLLLQDSWRLIFFADRKGKLAFSNDLVWALALFAALGALLLAGRNDVFFLTLAWGLAASVAALVGVLQSRVIPAPAKAMGWFKEQRDLSARFFGEFLAEYGAGHLAVFGVGIVAGLAALGTLRAGLLLLGPLNVIFMGVGMIAVPEGARFLAASGPGQLLRSAVLIAAFLAAAALAWGGLVALIPTSLGRELLGVNWDPARSVLIPLTFMLAAAGASVGALSALRALAAARRSLRASVLASVAALIGAVAGAALGGAPGSAWGSAAAAVAGSIAWWWQLSAALGEWEPEPGLERSPRG